jgi:hypothetical protein
MGVELEEGKMSKHTPGPWKVDRGGIEAVLDGESVQVANMSRTRWCGELSVKTKALAAKFKSLESGDACLIAAAPELLRMVKRVLGMHECKNNGLYNGEAILSESVADELRGVIDKAEGKAK